MNTCFNCGRKFHPVYSDQLFCSKGCRYNYHHRGDMILTLKKKWFDMILSGVKTEEYREIKPYWEKRFTNYFGRYHDYSQNPPVPVWNYEEKYIIFRNGYGKDKPEFTAECSISEGYGRAEWGAEQGVKYYVLRINRIVDVNIRADKGVGE